MSDERARRKIDEVLGLTQVRRRRQTPLRDLGITEQAHDPYMRALYEEPPVEPMGAEQDVIVQPGMPGVDEPMAPPPPDEAPPEVPDEIEEPEDENEEEKRALFNTLSELIDLGRVERSEVDIRKYAEEHEDEMGELLDVLDEVVDMLVVDADIWREPQTFDPESTPGQKGDGELRPGVGSQMSVGSTVSTVIASDQTALSGQSLKEKEYAGFEEGDEVEIVKGDPVNTRKGDRGVLIGIVPPFPKKGRVTPRFMVRFDSPKGPVHMNYDDPSYLKKVGRSKEYEAAQKLREAVLTLKITKGTVDEALEVMGRLPVESTNLMRVSEDEIQVVRDARNMEDVEKQLAALKEAGVEFEVTEKREEAIDRILRGEDIGEVLKEQVPEQDDEGEEFIQGEEHEPSQLIDVGDRVDAGSYGKLWVTGAGVIGDLWVSDSQSDVETGRGRGLKFAFVDAVQKEGRGSWYSVKYDRDDNFYTITGVEPGEVAGPERRMPSPYSESVTEQGGGGVTIKSTKSDDLKVAAQSIVGKGVEVLKVTRTSLGHYVIHAKKGTEMKKIPVQVIGKRMAYFGGESVTEQMDITRAAVAVEVRFGKKEEAAAAKGALLQYKGIDGVEEIADGGLVVFTTDADVDEARSRVETIMRNARIPLESVVVEGYEPINISYNGPDVMPTPMPLARGQSGADLEAEGERVWTVGSVGPSRFGGWEVLDVEHVEEEDPKVAVASILDPEIEVGDPEELDLTYLDPPGIYVLNYETFDPGSGTIIAVPGKVPTRDLKGYGAMMYASLEEQSEVEMGHKASQELRYEAEEGGEAEGESGIWDVSISGKNVGSVRASSRQEATQAAAKTYGGWGKTNVARRGEGLVVTQEKPNFPRPFEEQVEPDLDTEPMPGEGEPGEEKYLKPFYAPGDEEPGELPPGEEPSSDSVIWRMDVPEDPDEYARLGDVLNQAKEAGLIMSWTKVTGEEEELPVEEPEGETLDLRPETEADVDVAVPAYEEGGDLPSVSLEAGWGDRLDLMRVKSGKILSMYIRRGGRGTEYYVGDGQIDKKKAEKLAGGRGKLERLIDAAYDKSRATTEQVEPPVPAYEQEADGEYDMDGELNFGPPAPAPDDLPPEEPIEPEEEPAKDYIAVEFDPQTEPDERLHFPDHVAAETEDPETGEGGIVVSNWEAVGDEEMGEPTDDEFLMPDEEPVPPEDLPPELIDEGAELTGLEPEGYYFEITCDTEEEVKRLAAVGRPPSKAASRYNITVESLRGNELTGMVKVDSEKAAIRALLTLASEVGVELTESTLDEQDPQYQRYQQTQKEFRHAAKHAAGKEPPIRVKPSVWKAAMKKPGAPELPPDVQALVADYKAAMLSGDVELAQRIKGELEFELQTLGVDVKTVLGEAKKKPYAAWSSYGGAKETKEFETEKEMDAFLDKMDSKPGATYGVIRRPKKA